MCLELIGDLLAEVDDEIISELVELADHLHASLPPDQSKLLDELEERYLDRGRALARRALSAGIAMGRGLAQYSGPADEIPCVKGFSARSEGE